MKKPTKKKKPLIFSQDMPPYRHELLVCVGATHEDFKRWIKKFGVKEVKKDYLEWVGRNEKLFTEIKNGNQLGYALANLEKHYLILILPKYSDNWKYWECLIHELSHILDWLCEWKMLTGETEARAYLHEWLFNKIRRKISGVDKVDN